MSNSLGDLYFALGLDDTKFNNALEAAKEKIASLDKTVTVSVSVNAEQVQEALSKLSIKDIAPKIDSKTLEAQIAKLESNLTSLQAEIDKAMNRSTPNVKLISEKMEQRTGIENEIEDLKKKLAELPKEVEAKIPSVKIKLDLTKSEVSRIKREVRQSLADSGVDVSINPKISKEKAKRAVKAALENLEQTINVKPVIPKKNLKKIELEANQTTLRKSVTDALKNHRFNAKLDLIVDKASVQDAIKQAFAQAGMQWNTTASDVRAARVQEINSRTESKRLIEQEKLIQLQKKGLDSSKNSAKGLSNALHTSSDWASQLAVQFNNFISIYAIERFIRNLYTIGGEFQKQQIALQNMIGDVDKGNAIFERMKGLAVQSPFTFSDLASYTKQMAAYGIEYEELYDTTKRLADISAGVGVDMGRLILAYGQVRSAEVLRGQELRQFTEAGIPLVSELAKRLEEVRGRSVAVGEVFDAISKREISFGMVKDVLFDMTDPGGRFFAMQEELAKSLAGQWSNLKDAWDIMIADIANSSNNLLNGLASFGNDALRNWRNWLPVLSAIVGAIGAITSAIRVASVAEAAWNTITKANPWAIAASVIIGAAGAIIGYSAATEVASKNMQQINAELDEEIQKWNENRSNAMRYIDTLQSSNTTEERRVALYKELLDLYPEIFRNMKMEELMLMNSADLKTKINEETTKKQLAAINQRIEDKQEEIRRLQEKENGTISENNGVLLYTQGGLTKADKAEISKLKKDIIELEERKKDLQKEIDREGLIKALTPDSDVSKYIEVYRELGKAVKILRKGGVLGEITNPKEGTSVLEYYDQLSTALKEQEEISKKFKIGTPERTDADKLVKVYRAAISAIGGIWDTNNSRKKMSDAAKIDMNAYIEALKNEIARIGKQWDLFKDLMEASGNREMSANIAFGGQITFDNQLEQLKSRIMEEANKFGVGISLDELLGLGEKQLLERGVEEKAAKAIGHLIETYNKENEKLKDESVRNFIEILNASKDFEQQIADVERKLQKDLEDLRNNSEGMPNDEYARRRAKLVKKSEEDISKIRFEEFKESSNWVKVFDDLDLVSNNTLDFMTSQIKEFTKQTSLSQDEVKQLVEAMRKLREETIERNPLKAFKDAWGNLKDLNNAIKGKSNGKVVYTVTSKDGSIKQYNEEDYKQARFAEQSQLSNAALGVVSKFDAVGKAAGILGEFFDSAGSGVSHFLEAISSVTSSTISGAQAGASIGSVFGGMGGLYGAIAGAALGMLTSLFQQIDKSLQRAIEASERREKEIGNVAKNLETALERNMGGIFTMKLDDKTSESFSKVIENYNDAQNAISEWNGGKNNMELYRQLREFSHLQEDTIETIREALSEDSYFDAQLAALKIQRDEVQKQKQLEDEKKKTDKDKMLDYEQQIHELDDAINHFAEDMANALYGIDFKDWSERLAESLVDAWASGEDAVQAYRDTVNEILKDLGVSIISQKIIEPLLSKTMDDFLAQFEKDNGVLTDSSLDILAGMTDQAEYAAKATEAYLEGLKKLGIDLSDTSEEAKEGLSKGIQSVTEDTADLLASYLNAVRQDVSVDRSLMEKLIGEDVPRLSYIAEAQLRELNQIVANTKRNADAADSIRESLNSVIGIGKNGKAVKIV